MLKLPILLVALCAAPPASQDARALLDQGKYDELYLRFSAVKPSDLAPPERSGVAKALLEAALKLSKDPALTVSLAEKSAALEPSPAAFLAAGNANLALNQPSAAALDFEEAIKLSPDFAPALVARGELALKEGDGVLAEQLFSLVKPQAPERARAEQGLKSAKAMRAEKAKSLAELHKLERDTASATTAAAKAAGKSSDLDQVEACQQLTKGLCGVMQRCVPQVGDAAFCSSLMDSACAQGLAAQAAAAGPLPSRSQLQRCLKELSTVSCEKFGQGPAAMMTIPGCAGIQLPGEPAPDGDKEP